MSGCHSLKAKLETGEHLLKKYAKAVERGKSWTKCLTAHLVHAAFMGVVWYKEGPLYGLATLASGVAVSELIT